MRFLPSTASPFDIFFKYIVISAALSVKGADMLTSGKEPVDRSSAIQAKKNIQKNVWEVERKVHKTAVKMYPWIFLFFF